MANRPLLDSEGNPKTSPKFVPFQALKKKGGTFRGVRVEK